MGVPLTRDVIRKKKKINNKIENKKEEKTNKLIKKCKNENEKVRVRVMHPYILYHTKIIFIILQHYDHSL